VETILWDDEAVLHAHIYGLDTEDVETIVRNRSNPVRDPHSNDVDHEIIRYTAGDVVAVVGFKDPEPKILSVWINMPDDVRRAGTTKGGGPGTNLPRTIRDLKKRILARGYKIKMGGSHEKVYSEDGTFITTIPATPSDHRSIPNAWKQFIRNAVKYEKEGKL